MKFVGFRGFPLLAEWLLKLWVWCLILISVWSMGNFPGLCVLGVSDFEWVCVDLGNCRPD